MVLTGPRGPLEYFLGCDLGESVLELPHHPKSLVSHAINNPREVKFLPPGYTAKQAAEMDLSPGPLNCDTHAL